MFTGAAERAVQDWGRFSLAAQAAELTAADYENPRQFAQRLGNHVAVARFGLPGFPNVWVKTDGWSVSNIILSLLKRIGLYTSNTEFVARRIDQCASRVTLDQAAAAHLIAVSQFGRRAAAPQSVIDRANEDLAVREQRLAEMQQQLEEQRPIVQSAAQALAGVAHLNTSLEESRARVRAQEAQLRELAAVVRGNEQAIQEAQARADQTREALEEAEAHARAMDLELLLLRDESEAPAE